jgi:hypothetical protein
VVFDKTGGTFFARQSIELPDFVGAGGTVGPFVLSHDATLLSKAAFTNVAFR